MSVDFNKTVIGFVDFSHIWNKEKKKKKKNVEHFHTFIFHSNYA